MDLPPMTQLSPDRAPEASDTLICGLTPSGRIDVRPIEAEDGPRKRLEGRHTEDRRQETPRRAAGRKYRA